ncbi:MAG: hypothetical protein KC419_27135, partial [Anaerolineales bacterium]|nr:hypothetical protein [Anaerolineales bacterium]
SAAAAGAVQVNLNVGDMGMTGQPVTPENRGILLGVGDMGMSGQPVTVQVGHVTVNLNVGEMGMTGQQVTPENRGVLLGVGDMGMTGLPVAVSLGKVQINLNVGDMGMTGQSAAINLIDTAVQINLNVGQMGMIGIPVSLPSRFVAIPTHHVQREFSFNLKPPLINPDAFQFRELFPQAKSYSQVNKDIGGYWSATLETEIDRRELDFWLNHALMSHLEVYAPTLDQIGEFFVNKITLSIGRLQITLGPVLDVVNKLAVAYAEMILDENGEPIIGENKYTDWQQDSASQTRYGIIEAIHNGGQLIDVLATQQAQINLAELKDPKHEESETGGTAVPHVSFDLMGYVHLLKLFTYQNNTEYDTENLSTKLTNAISADPNGIFPGTFPNVATNTTQVSKNESAARPAWTIIKELIELGDDSLNQYVFTVGNGRQITYAQIPTDIAYVTEHDRTDYRTPQNQIVQPWNVLPGRWLQYTDLLIGEPDPSTLTERARSPKFPFLKSTTFTLPDQIAYQSGEALTPSDILARRYALERSR